MPRKSHKYNDIDDTQALLRILALADKEIEAGETISIEEIMREFGVESSKTTESKPIQRTARNLF